MALTFLVFPNCYLRIFSEQDVKDIMDDREHLAQDLASMKVVVGSLLARYKNDQSLDIHEVMNQLEQLMIQVEGMND